jgi:hypothetical protein
VLHGIDAFDLLKAEKDYPLAGLEDKKTKPLRLKYPLLEGMERHVNRMLKEKFGIKQPQ